MATQRFSKTGQEEEYISWWLEIQRKREDTKVIFEDMYLEVRREVFSPNPMETYSTKFILECLPSLHTKTVLDVGCGCGVLSIHAFRQGASHIVAVDSDLIAVENTKTNLTTSRALSNVVVKQSDLFAYGAEKYDVILANLPIVDIAWPQIESGTQNLYARFVDQLPLRLNDGGQCYLTFASFGDIAGFDRLISKQPLRSVIHMAEKFNVNWYVIKLAL